MKNRITQIDDLDALLGLKSDDMSAGPGPDETAAIIHYLLGPGDTRDYDRGAPFPHTVQIGKSVLVEIIEDNIDHLSEVLEEDMTPGARRDARVRVLEQRKELLEWVMGHPEVNVRVTLTLPKGLSG